VQPSGLTVSAVYASPLIRARQTAQQMFPGQAIVLSSDLAERNMGDWDGLSWPEIEIRWPDQAAAAARDWFAYTPPNAESWTQFEARIQRAWRAMPRQGDLAIVAHAGVNAVLSNLLAGTELTTFRQNYEEIITLAIPD
jgi:broad specificity phosphatase PhoE